MNGLCDSCALGIGALRSNVGLEGGHLMQIPIDMKER